MARNITPREKDYSQWYLDVIKAAEMADYAPVRGVHGHPPYGVCNMRIHTKPTGRTL